MLIQKIDRMKTASSALCGILIYLSTATAHSQVQDKPASVKSLSGDFTLVFDAVSSTLKGNNEERDLNDALRQYDAMYKSGQMNKQTYDSFVSSMKNSVEDQAKTKKFRVTISHSTSPKALLCQASSPDVQQTSIFTAGDQRTFSSSSKADLNYVFQGLRVDWMPGFIPLAGSVGDIDCITNITQTKYAATLLGKTLDTTRAAREPTYDEGYIRLKDGDLSRLQPFGAGVKGFIARDWYFSKYIDVSGLHVPSQIELTVNGMQHDNLGKPVFQETLKLVSATNTSLPLTAFSYDTYLPGRKGIQFDDGKSLISFPYQMGRPIEQQAEAESMRRRARPGATHAISTYTGSAALITLILAGTWLMLRRKTNTA